MTTDAEDFVERLTKVCTEAKELLREMHSEAKELRRLIALASNTCNLLDAAIKQMIAKDIAEEVSTQLDEFDAQVKVAMDRSVKKVTEEFDRIISLMITGNTQGRFDLAKVANDAQRAAIEKEGAPFALPSAGRKRGDPLYGS